MNAFVLSGGANLGSIQAGMLEGLLDAGIVPDVLVGVSIGAANAAFLAADPTPDRARELSDLWRRIRSRDVFPLSPLRLGRAMLGRASLFEPRAFRRLLDRELPYRRIEDAPVPLRIVATRFTDGSQVVLDRGSVVDGVLASTALPGVFPPHAIGDDLYLDGALSEHVPLSPAIAAGADTLYVLAVGFPCAPPTEHRSVRAMLMHSFDLLLSQRVRLDIDHLPSHHPTMRVIQIPPVCTRVPLRDFSRSAVLIDRAKQQTSAFLRGEETVVCPHRLTSSEPALGRVDDEG